MAHPVFKTGRARKPRAWKVRFLRRFALGTPRAVGSGLCAGLRGRAGRCRPGPHELRPEGSIPPMSARGPSRELPGRVQPPARAQDALQRDQRLVATRAPITSRPRGALSLSQAEASIFRASDDTLGPRPRRERCGARRQASLSWESSSFASAAARPCLWTDRTGAPFGVPGAADEADYESREPPPEASPRSTNARW